MTLLPIVRREMHVASRRGGTYWGRVSAALAALLLATYIFAVGRQQPVSQLSLMLFVTLTWIAFVLCALAGPWLTADCLSRERREETLGLLFLTDLRGHDVVLGKLAASSLQASYSLVAIFPILAISLLLGGVAWKQFWEVALSLLNMMFASLAAGIFVSVWCRSGRKAAVLAFLMLLFWIVAPWVAAVTSAVNQGRGSPPEGLLSLSPTFATVVACFGQASSPFSPRWYWPNMALTFFAAAAFLSVASVMLPRIWHELPTGAWRRRFRKRLRSDAGRPRKAQTRRRLLSINPFLWLASYDRNRSLPWAFIGCSGALWLWGYAEYGRDWLEGGSCLMLAYLLHAVFKFWVVFAVVARIGEDKQSGALELILTTPLDQHRIFSGQVRALARFFGGPLLAVLVIDLLAWNLIVTHTYGERRFITLLFAAHLGAMIADLAAISWLGMWQAASARRPTQSAINTIGLVLLLPWVAFIVFASVTDVFKLPSRFPWLRNDDAVLGIWFGIAVVNDLIWILWSASRLRTRFRTVVARPGPERAAWLLKLFRG